MPPARNKPRSDSNKQRSEQSSPPRELGRRARRRIEVRERLFTAATGLFSSHGLHATTIKDITEAADVGKGTFFNYFPSKEHVLAMFYERQLEAVNAALQAAREEREPLESIMPRLFRELREPASRSPALVRSFITAIVSNDAVGKIVLPTLLAIQQGFEQLYRMGQERGIISRLKQPAALARIGQDAAFGTALFWSLNPTVPLEALLAENRQIIWADPPASPPTSAKNPPRRRQQKARR
jgi:AcrR family transcriptional regulator